jgi:hypothetical protein
MKALTLTQPYASLVAVSAKKIETRSWSTSYRGSLAIHAAKGFPKWAKEICLEDPFWVSLGKEWCAFGRQYSNPARKLPLGAVLATCRLANVLPVEVLDNAGNVFGVSLPPLSEQEKAFGDYNPGRYAWILEDVKTLAVPIPAKGALGLWEWTS